MLFARYAFPPNHHGYCGPADTTGFPQLGLAGDDRGLRAMAQEFAGAWPYLELIAHGTGLDDPLDRRVVEAYWVGSPRLDRIGVRAIGNSMEDRFRWRSGPRFGSSPRACWLGASPTTALPSSASTPGLVCLVTIGGPRRRSRARPVPDSLGSGTRCSR